ncbi:hypothetical protein CJU90_3123 [Yarrowia sp. C11]|nr:hypothetical protein CKK34_4572 [Yarrowia sp. E02]KAG5369647.1 hypothetical protein CJU90_3123 [Yarrowia sp. C11]
MLFDNGERSRYHELELMLFHYVSAFPETLNISMAFMRCLCRSLLVMLGPEYRTHVGLESRQIPDWKWQERMLKVCGSRTLKMLGKRGGVNEILTLENLIDGWRIIEGYTAENIYNADQTSFITSDANSEDKPLYTRQIHVDQTRSANLKTCAILCCNFTGSVKLWPWLFNECLKPSWIKFTQYHWNPESIVLPHSTPNSLTADAMRTSDWIDLNNELRRLSARDRSLKNKQKKAEEALPKARLGSKHFENCKKRLEVQAESITSLETKIAAVKDQQAELVAVYVTSDAAKERASELYRTPLFSAEGIHPKLLEEMSSQERFGIPHVYEETAKSLEVSAHMNVKRQDPGATVEKLQPEDFIEASLDGPKFTGPVGLINARYMKQEEACMDARVMCNWLRYFKEASGASPTNKKLLILDNVDFHHHCKEILSKWPELAGIEILFLPPGTTSYMQPLGLGAIHAVETAVLKKEAKLEALNARLGLGRPYQLSNFFRVNFFVKSWEDLSPRVIENCFCRSPVFACLDEANHQIPDDMAGMDSESIDSCISLIDDIPVDYGTVNDVTSEAHAEEETSDDGDISVAEEDPWGDAEKFDDEDFASCLATLSPVHKRAISELFMCDIGKLYEGGMEAINLNMAARTQRLKDPTLTKRLKKRAKTRSKSLPRKNGKLDKRGAYLKMLEEDERSAIAALAEKNAIALHYGIELSDSDSRFIDQSDHERDANRNSRDSGSSEEPEVNTPPETHHLGDLGIPTPPPVPSTTHATPTTSATSSSSVTGVTPSTTSRKIISLPSIDDLYFFGRYAPSHASSPTRSRLTASTTSNSSVTSLTPKTTSRRINARPGTIIRPVPVGNVAGSRDVIPRDSNDDICSQVSSSSTVSTWNNAHFSPNSSLAPMPLGNEMRPHVFTHEDWVVDTSYLDYNTPQ